MSGRIWAVEQNKGTRIKADWHLVDYCKRRSTARYLQSKLRGFYQMTRVVQYVRQGGAR